MYATAVERPPLEIMRYGTIMRPLPTDPREAWGVLNPGSARGPDGQLYLFPRIVAEGNVSRVAIGRVRFGRDGEPIDVDRLGIVLEPETPYEMAPGGLGGCEDPRITYIAAIDRYVMAYAALDYMHPRVALAISRDLLTWQRLGLVDLAPELGIEWNALTDKDASFFPEPVNDPEGRPSLALVHRPTYMMSHPDATITVELPHGVEDPRDSIWISYADLAAAQGDVRSLTHLRHHRLLATPRADWEQLKIGGGTAPVLTHLGWLMLYHGVTVEPQVVPSAHPLQKRVRYTAGAMVLDRDDPTRVLYRSPKPILEPTVPEERQGIVEDVVFPTTVDLPTPPGPGARVDVYYGMADTVIGAGWLILPPTLPTDSDPKP